MKRPSPEEVRAVGMSTVAAAHAVYVETVRQNFGEKGLDALAEGNRLHGLELGMQGVKDGGLRKDDLKSIHEFFAAAHPFFGFEVELEDVSENQIDVRVTVCPWIETFRAKGAKEDICHWVTKIDEGIAQAVNPNLKMNIPMCMMRGDVHCIYRWTKTK